jgi:hypothetical protein
MPATVRPSRSPEGITLRHRSRCAARSGRPCDCRPAYQAQVYSPRDRKTLRKTFGSLADARAWRSEIHTALNRGTLRAPSRTTLELVGYRRRCNLLGLATSREGPRDGRGLAEKLRREEEAGDRRRWAQVDAAVGGFALHVIEDGAAEITLSVKASRERIRVEVADDGLAGTAPPGEGDAERAGWDLHFIQVLSDRCGIDGEGQECAWCELVDSGAFPSRAAR